MVSSLEGYVKSLQLSRTHSAATYDMKSTSSYLGGAECASWRKVLFLARPQLLRVVSRVTRNHAGANALLSHFHGSQARHNIFAQQCVQPDLVVRAALELPSQRKPFSVSLADSPTVRH